MIISLIVAVSTNNAIGKDNQLLWHLPNDMKFFKMSTWAMPVVMGRKTFESMAGKPLNGRLNIVITRQNNWTADGVVVVHSLEQAIAAAKEKDYKELFVIGGGEIYREALPIAQKIYLTRVEAAPEADTFFPEWNSGDWKLVHNDYHPADTRHAYPYRFQIWEKPVS
ncbi:MAG TPA: dihydrofolate reductase [Sediminibacterium sp.]|nr:dihydrofolate reductase [Sediminibacterium sp.]